MLDNLEATNDIVGFGMLPKMILKSLFEDPGCAIVCWQVRIKADVVGIRNYSAKVGKTAAKSSTRWPGAIRRAAISNSVLMEFGDHKPASIRRAWNFA